MTEDVLKLGPKVTVGAEEMDQRFALLGSSGSGKTSAASVLAEEMFGAGMQFVVVDPVGAWWGLRSLAPEGKKAGLPIPVFGGEVGDVPLEPTAGKLMAELVVGEGLSCVLDVSSFDSEAQKRRFLTDFAEHLFQIKGKIANRDQLWLFLEEADDYAPQKTIGGDMARTLGAFQRIVKRGRARGIFPIMLSQRSAALNKDLLTQADTLIALRTLSPQDRKAIEGWIEAHAQSKEILDSLNQLEDGECWMWSPQRFKMVKRFRWRRRLTFDSGATPTGRRGKVRQPATLADVDLDAIKLQMADTIEKAKDSDPALLKRQLAEARKEISEARKVAETNAELAEMWRRRASESVEVGVPVLSPEQVREVAGLRNTLEDLLKLPQSIEERKTLVGTNTYVGNKPLDEVVPPPGTIVFPSSDKPVSELHPPGDIVFVPDAREKLPLAQRRILTALVQAGGPRSKSHLATIAGYPKRGSTLRNALSGLRIRGLIEGSDPLMVTQEGHIFLGSDIEPLPAPGLGLFLHWKEQVPLASQRVLEALYSEKGTLSKVTLASKTGYDVAGSTLRNALSRLRVLGLVSGSDPITLAEELMG